MKTIWDNEKEQEVIKLFKLGHSYKAIAKKLNLKSDMISRKLKSLGFISEGALKAKEIKDLSEKGLRKCFKCKTIYPNDPALFVTGRKPAATCLSCQIKINKKNYDSLKENMSVDEYIKDKVVNAKYRCLKRGEDFNIDASYIKDLYEKQKGLCYYSEIPMNIYGTRSTKLYSLSLDRIDNTKGYLKENVVLCCNIINTMKNTLPLQEFIKICKKISIKFN